MKRTIVWFKNDLRIHDNETLIYAIAHSDEVIPVYCFDDSQFATTEFGFQKTGFFRTRFLLESVANLKKNLQQLGSDLLVVKGTVEEELKKIALRYSAQKIVAKKEVAFEEINTLDRVEKELWKIKCELLTFSTSTLYRAEDLPFSIKDIPDTFTEFRKAVEKESTIRNPFPAPTSIKSPAFPAAQLPALESFGLEEKSQDPRTAFKGKGGETEALKRLDYYFFESKAITNYKDTRNGMIGEDYSTKLSPWLATGCLSPKQLYAELKHFEKTQGANDSTYWVIFELLWRDYFRFMMKKYQHRYFTASGIRKKEVVMPPINQSVLAAWIEGETGNPFVDANMKELKYTGFMSNRGRQNVASYFCNELKQDWRYGAAYFEQALIDYDACSNWGNWAYLAGVGNDPRGNRIFNIDKQSKQYDPQGEYVKLWT